MAPRVPQMLRCLLRRKGQRASTTPAVRPQNQPGRRCKTIPWTDLLTLAPGIDSAQGIPRRKCPEWLHPPQQVTMGFPGIIHQEKEKDGSLCLCIDFHTLNRVTEKDHYPLPLIPDLFNSPGPARIYSKIDLKHSYHLVQIVEGDKPKTAFHMHYGSYEWQVMPFSLTNTPAVFQ